MIGLTMESQVAISERDRDKQRKRTQRAADHDVIVPPCEDIERRLSLEADDIAWLMYYFGEAAGVAHPFTYDFVPQQREMIALIGHAIRVGGDSALAASRGEGKTTLARRLLCKYVLQGVLRFPVLFCATGGLAENSLEAIKADLVGSAFLSADYPEVCVPIEALENTPNRAHYQTVSGQRFDNGEPFHRAPSKFSWCGTKITMPDVPGSPAAGAIIATRGLDSAVRGLNVKGARPDLALIDDADTDETMRSEDQAAKLSTRIESSIGGLGSQTNPIARVMLCTIPSRTSVAFMYTDPAQKPTWMGRRYRFLVKPPTRLDLWEQYMDLRREILRDVADGKSEDKTCRGAHAFLLEHYDEMHDGAEVANPNRFDGRDAGDGTTYEVSAVQRYFNEVVRLGQENVSTEYDNDPPEPDEDRVAVLTPYRVQHQRGGYERRTVPPDVDILVQGIDVGKTALHWVVRAFTAQDGYTVDHGVQEVHGTVVGTDEGVDTAIMRAVISRWEDVQQTPYETPEGQPVPIRLTLIDAGYWTQAVYAVCRQIGPDIMPSKGFGRSSGTIRANFSDILYRTKDRRPGDGWFLSKQTGGTWLVCIDADRWKVHEHNRWLNDTGSGAMNLYGAVEMSREVERDHLRECHAYSHHVCNEREIEVPKRDGKTERRWKVYGPNHWLDASVLTHVAASMRGIQLGVPMGGKVQRLPNDKRPEGNERPTLAQMAAARGGH